MILQKTEVKTFNMEIAEKEIIIIELLSSLDSLAIAFSGGVDSSLLAVLANKYVKEKVLLVNACTPFSTEIETLFVNKWAKENNYDLEIIKADILQIPEIQKNQPERCYHCKKFLMKKIHTIAKHHGIERIADGSNMDDLSDYRPGHKATEELGIIHPFIEAQITKKEIQKLAKKYNLENWNAPAQACLATRIPVNTPILDEDLRKIEKAEDYLHKIGFLACRVRKLGDMAKIEIPQTRIEDFLIHREMIADALKQLEFQQVLLDLEGYRQGSMNRK